MGTEGVRGAGEARGWRAREGKRKRRGRVRGRTPERELLWEQDRGPAGQGGWEWGEEPQRRHRDRPVPQRVTVLSSANPCLPSSLLPDPLLPSGHRVIPLGFAGNREVKAVQGQSPPKLTEPSLGEAMRAHSPAAGEGTSHLLSPSPCRRDQRGGRFPWGGPPPGWAPPAADSSREDLQGLCHSPQAFVPACLHGAPRGSGQGRTHSFNSSPWPSAGMYLVVDESPQNEWRRK